MTCKGCAERLTAEERHFYEDTCERCERAWSDRIGAWRSGGEDAELDRAFSEPPVTLH